MMVRLQAGGFFYFEIILIKRPHNEEKNSR